MSNIKNLDEVRRNKRARKRLNQEKQELELEILILQKRLEVIQGFLDGPPYIRRLRITFFCR